MVQEPCPFQTIISLETALLVDKLKQNQHEQQGLRIITLQSFCVACRQKRRLKTLLSLQGLLSDKADDDKTCERPSCLKSKFQTTKYCTAHLLFRPAPTSFPVPRLDQSKVRAGMDHIQWTCRPILQEVIRRYNCIIEREMPQGMLVCLDIEFSPSSQKVFEIGVCEFESGKPLVNARVKYNCPKNELHRAPPFHIDNPYLRLISMRTSQKIYHRNQPSDTLLDVHGIATKFREGGITPDTILLVWAKNGQDLELVRKLFDGENNKDYQNILPSKAHCAYMIPDFRRNMPTTPGLSIFPLEIIFNLLFGNHDLADKNHRALSDALQLRLMVKLFIELCKPPEKRQLSLLPRSIEEYFPKLLQCKQEKDHSLTTQQRRDRNRLDDRDRLELNSWTRTVSNPLKRKQRTLDGSVC